MHVPKSHSAACMPRFGACDWSSLGFTIYQKGAKTLLLRVQLRRLECCTRALSATCIPEFFADLRPSLEACDCTSFVVCPDCRVQQKLAARICTALVKKSLVLLKRQNREHLSVFMVRAPPGFRNGSPIHENTPCMHACSRPAAVTVTDD